MESPGRSASKWLHRPEQAAAWLARKRSGQWTHADEVAFGVWLRSNPAHPAEWLQCEELWHGLDAVRDHPDLLRAREVARARLERGASMRWFRRLGPVAAAAVILIAAGWWGFAKLSYLTTPAQTIAAREEVRNATTEVGQRSTLDLPDGSTVTLNTASSVHIHLSATERRVTLLYGEAFFKVAKDPNRPFVVVVGSREVVDVGTQFAVRITDRRILVTLVEGRLLVLPKIQNVRLTGVGLPDTGIPGVVTLNAGMRLTVRSDGSQRVQKLDADSATAWRNGELVFDGEPLAKVVAEMNRYSRRKLKLASPSLGSHRISGVFRLFTSDVASSFAHALQAYGIVRIRHRSGSTIWLESPNHK